MNTTAIATEPDAQPITAGPQNGSRKKAPGGALTRLKARAQQTHDGKGGQLRRRRMGFTVDKNICDPGAFDEDFELVVVSASSDVELDALKECSDNPAAVMYAMVKRCIVSCDGEPVGYGDGSIITLWEALGTGGRSMLVRKWNELCGNTDPEALKKADSSTRLFVV